MPEASPTTQDEAGVTRTPTGTIVDQSPTSTPPSETIVRPPPTPSTTQSVPKGEETKPAEAKPDGKPAEAGKSLLNEKSEGPTGAPEKYEDFKVPEGYTLDPQVAQDAGALFKKHNLSQAGAQELVDFYVAKTKEAYQQPYDAYNELRQKWRDEVNGDPEIGGSKLHATRVSVGRLLDSLGDSKLSEAFRAEMDITGMGDHPVFVKVLARLANRLTEGGAVRGNGPSVEGQRAPGEGRPSAAQALYPNLPTRG